MPQTPSGISFAQPWGKSCFTGPQSLADMLTKEKVYVLAELEAALRGHLATIQFFFRQPLIVLITLAAVLILWHYLED